MNTLSTTLKVLISAIFIMALTTIAQAQATRTWVSGVGDDVNPCSRTAPCKTWAGAISKTAAGGEIDALDPGGFGTLTITKSITVDGTNGQGFGSTLNSGGISGFTINDSLTAAPGTIKVQLRNLSINGPGTTLGTNGIRMISGSKLHVENVRIQNQSGDGIQVSNATQVMSVMVENVTVSNVGGNGFSLNNGNAQATIYRSTFKDSTNGVTDFAGVINIDSSNISHNSTNGINATSSASLMHVSNNVIASNGTGINSALGSVVRISNNDVWRNNTGLNIVGTMESYRNNKVRGSVVANISGALTDVSAINTGVF
jgi:hypothetical protein